MTSIYNQTFWQQQTQRREGKMNDEEQRKQEYEDKETRSYTPFRDGEGRLFTPRTHFLIKKWYEKRLLEGKFDEINRYESSHRIPQTWLNSTISELIDDLMRDERYGLASSMLTTFSTRAHCSIWKEKGAAIGKYKSKDREVKVC